MRRFALFLTALFAAPAAAQTNPYTWQIGTGNWSVAANWQNGAAAAEVPPSSDTTQLVFNGTGTTNYTATNNLGALTINRLTVNHAGTGTVTLAGPVGNTLTFAGADPTLNVTGTSVFTGLMAGSATVTKTGTGTFIHDSNNAGFTGTLIVNAGLFVNRSTAAADTNFNPVSIVVNSGGTYRFGENGAGNPNLPNGTIITLNTGGTVIWEEAEDFGSINLNGGTLNLRVAGYNAQGSTPSVWTSGTVTGGAFAVAGTGSASTIDKTTAGTVTVTGGASLTGTGTMNIRDGRVVFTGAANLGTKDYALGSADGLTAGIYEYNGATATKTLGTFFVDVGGGIIRITDPAANLTSPNIIAGVGPLTKQGPGGLTFTTSLVGLDASPTTVAEGTLRFVVNPGQFDYSTPITVAAGATLAVGAGDGSTAFSVPAITSAGTVRVELNTGAVPAGSLVVVRDVNGLAGSGVLAVSNQQSLATGTYKLIDYAGTPIASGYTLSLPGRTAGGIIYNTADTRIDFTVTGTDTIKWTGANGAAWDRGTAAGVGGTNNFQLVLGGTPTNFIDTDTVTFDDTATAFTVNLNETVRPAIVTVNNSAANPYTIQGTGKISGDAGLIKLGAGTLRLGTDNDYSGSTTVAAGKLQLGAGGTAGAVLGPISLAAGTTLAFDRSAAFTAGNQLSLGGAVTLEQNGAGAATLTGALAMATETLTLTGNGAGNTVLTGPISGTGNIVKTGTSTFVLGANNNPFTGTLTIDAGRVILQDIAGGDLSAANIIVNNGGAFQFGQAAGENPDLPANTIVTVNAGGTVEWRIGEDFAGVQLQGGSILFNGGNVNATLATVTLIWTEGTVTGIGATNNGHTNVAPINKTTAGTVAISGTAFVSNPLNIQEGVWSLATAANVSGNAITLGTATTAGTYEYLGAAAATRAGTVGLIGAGTVRVADPAGQLTLSGVVSNTGAFTKTGDGTLVLSASNTYTGGTTVSAGRLAVTGQTGTNSGTGTGSVIVAAGATLGGTGRVGGASNILGTVAPGLAGPGTLTVGGGMNLEGTYLARVTGTAGSRLQGDAGVQIVLGVGSLLAFDPANTYDGATTYTLIDAPGGLAGTFSNYANGALIPGGAFAVQYTATQVQLAPVPEPGLVLLAAGAGLAYYRRRRVV